MKFALPTVTSNQDNTNSKQWPQYLAVLTASLSSWACGLHFAWPSPSLPRIILAPEFPANITADEGSYIAIMQPLGDILGAPLAAALTDVIGRKMVLLMIGPPLFISWIIIAFAQDTVTFCLARFICGIGDGFLFIVLPMYIGEVTEPKVRGVLGCTLSVSMIIGMLMINCLAPYVSVQNTALICSLSPVILIITFMWMPESPYYLMMKGKVAEARKALYFLRRCDIDKDLDILDKDVKRQMSENGTFKDLICIKSNRRALCIMLGIRAMQQGSGISVWLIVTQTIFIKANSDLSPVICTIIFLVIQLLVTTSGSFLVDRFGRKPLLMLSSFLCGIILCIGSTYFFLEEQTNYNVSHLNWLPVMVMIIFIIVFGFGLGTVPTLMLGEMFSASIKGKALCVMCIYYACNITIVLKLFHYMSEVLGFYSPFLLFGVFCFINVFMAYIFVPETKGKSLEDIQQILKGNKNPK